MKLKKIINKITKIDENAPAKSLTFMQGTFISLYTAMILSIISLLSEVITEKYFNNIQTENLTKSSIEAGLITAITLISSALYYNLKKKKGKKLKIINK